MSDVLEKLFGSKARVKVLRLFLFNPHEGFSALQIAKQTGIQKRTAQSNAKRLQSIGFLHVEKVKSSSKRTKKSKVNAWHLNHQFPFLRALRDLLTQSPSFDTSKLCKQIESTGDIKLLLLSGVFLHKQQAPLDICIVGDGLNTKKIEQIVNDFEQELGTQLSYAVLSTAEFEYRYSIYDRFARDLFTHPHELPIDELGVKESEE